MIQLMLPLHECADPTLAESATEPVHSVGDFAAVEEFVVEPLHSAAAESTAEPLQSIADSNATIDALTETSCS
jgi:hypothetical protein